MKATKTICAAVVLAAMMVSCVREAEAPDSLNTGIEMEFTAAWAKDGDSRTLVAENGTNILWSVNERINAFYGTQYAGVFTSTNTEPSALVTFEGRLNILTGSLETENSQRRYWAIYPYNENNTCDGQSVTLSLLQDQTGRAGTFADKLFPAIASGTTPDLAFYNVCGGARFSVVTEGVQKIVFRSNDGSPMAGTVRVDFGGDGKPQILGISDAKDSVVVNAPANGFIPGNNYFAAMLPQTHKQGLTVTLYTATKKATKTITQSITVRRSAFGTLDNVDNGIIEWEDYATEAEGGGTRSGLYLGIIGFNDQLYQMPIGRLNAATYNHFTAFIDGLTTRKATLLYYSVGESLKALSRARYPENLFNVSLLTFTDGLDQGSSMMIEDYPGDDEYLQILNNRLTTTVVQGVPLTAYSVGLKGSDVSDVTKFRNNLKKLATPESNAFEVSDMSTVKSRFQAIADQVNQKLSSYQYDLSLTIPGQANGTRMRFTLDNVSSATSSNLYIEGVFNLSSKSLTEVSYHGLTAGNGGTVRGEVDGIYVRFSFTGMVIGDGKSDALNKANIRHWTYVASSGSWQRNSEFDAEKDASVEVTKSQKSAVVLLNLDCSTSLSSSFSTLKTHAKSFVQRLYEASFDPSEVTGITLDKTSINLYIGKSSTLIATVTPSTAADKSVIWTSSDPSVAMVSTKGVIEAISEGTCTIEATTNDGGYTASCEVEVKPILINSIKFDKTNLSLNEGATDIISATVSPEDATEKSLTWTSSVDSVATVDEFGKIKALKKGTTTIKATANDGSGQYATCSVTVKRPVSSITIEPASLIIHTGESKTLTATVAPETATNTSCTWSSSNTSVATVSTSGVVKGIARGTVIITATAKDGSGAVGTCEVEVRQYVTSITLDKTSLVLNEGESSTVSASSVQPDNANDKSVVWSSSDEEIATVDQTGKITAVSKGTATIKGTANDGSGKYATCSVTVKRLVSSITIEPASLIIHIGESKTLHATVYPETANNTSYTWSSSNTSVATVSTSGVVKGVAKGTVIITATAKDGSGVTGTCEVDVRKYVTSITLDKTSLVLNEGESSTISVSSVKPDDANDKSVTWSSSNEEIATVDQTGKVTAVSKGTATIKATANDGSGKNASCPVRVWTSHSVAEAIDLGLSVKWASWNIGSSSPEDYGEYFAWGETEPKEDYRWSTYKWGKGSYPTMTKYCTDSGYGYNGFTDGKTVLDAEDDAAAVNWGGSWRMPTQAEQDELRSQCTLTWTTNYNGTGVKGRLVTGPNGNSIFLPAAGYRDGTSLYSAGSCGRYWFSSLKAGNPGSAFMVYFSFSSVDWSSGDLREYGRSVRPVSK